jgi:CubicO group peptidase (beta-lactamase class C family)
VAVRKDDQIVHLKSYGYANLETGAKMTLGTIFDLGSLSKQFTALAVKYLAHFENKIKLEELLSNYFKRFPPYADEITIEDLLHHTSGLPDYFDLYVAKRLADRDWYTNANEVPDDWYPEMQAGKKDYTNKDVVRWIASQPLLPREPDTAFEYSNSGYVVLAELISKVTKKRLGRYLKDFLFRHVQMNDTYVFDERSRFSANDPKIVNHAKCYNQVDGKFVPVGYTPMNFITGDGNVHSTILDLLRWELHLYSNEWYALVDPQKFEDSGFRNLSELLWKSGKTKKGKRVGYGAGWNLHSEKYDKEFKVKGKKVTRRYESRAEYHRGKWLGWRHYWARAARWAIPERGGNVDPKTLNSLGIIVLSNANFGAGHFTTCTIAQEISKVFWRKDNIMSEFDC